jgi:hypothetical protein
MEECQTRNAQDLSFRKQTHKQKHELTKELTKMQVPASRADCCIDSVSTVHQPSRASAGIGGAWPWPSTSTDMDAALPGAELLSVSSRNHALAERQFDPLTIEFARPLQLPSPMRPTVEPRAAMRADASKARSLDCQGASRGCLRQHGLPPTSAHFSPLQPTPAHSSQLQPTSRPLMVSNTDGHPHCPPAIGPDARRCDVVSLSNTTHVTATRCHTLPLTSQSRRTSAPTSSTFLTAATT